MQREVFEDQSQNQNQQSSQQNQTHQNNPHFNQNQHSEKNINHTQLQAHNQDYSQEIQNTNLPNLAVNQPQYQSDHTKTIIEIQHQNLQNTDQETPIRQIQQKVSLSGQQTNKQLQLQQSILQQKLDEGLKLDQLSSIRKDHNQLLQKQLHQNTKNDVNLSPTHNNTHFQNIDESDKRETEQINQVHQTVKQNLKQQLFFQNQKQHQLKFHQKAESYSSCNSLRVLYDHYSKMSYTTGRNMTFERMQHETHILTINKFMIWCKDFKITSKIAVMKLMDIFKREGTNHKELNFQQFMQAVEKISEQMFQGENRMRQMEKFLKISSQSQFKQKCKQLHIFVPKPISSNMRIRLKRYQQKQKQKFQNHAPSQQSGRMIKIKSEAIRQKAISNMEKYDYKKQSGQSYANLRAINKSIKLKQIKHESGQSSELDLFMNYNNDGRYARVKSVNRYKLNSIVSQAKEQMSQQFETKPKQSFKVQQKISSRQEQKKDSFLSSLIGMDEEEDQILQALQKQLLRKRVTSRMTKRIEEARKIEQGKDRKKIHRRINEDYET